MVSLHFWFFLLPNTWTASMHHHAQVTIHSKHKISYSIMYCNLVKMDLLTSNSFPSSFHVRLSAFPYWRLEHEDVNKFQVSFNGHILFLSPSSCVEQKLVILPNYDDSHEHVAFCTTSPMCTRSSCTHTQPVSLPFANSLWSQLPVVKCLRKSRL